jgi:hypothetical protein
MKNGRTTADRKATSQAIKKLVMTHYSNGTKDAMITRRK